MLIYVPLSQIDDNPYQARQEYGDVAELGQRIAAARTSYPDSYGLMQIPRGRVILRNSRIPEGQIIGVASVMTMTNKHHELPADSAVRVQLAFGHRRLRAFRHLWGTQEPGYERGIFPVHIGELTDDQMLDAVWAENRERKDISSVEEAELLARKVAQVGNQRLAAEAWGIARATVANKLALLELPEEIKQANRDGRLSERAALALAPVVAIQKKADKSKKWANKDESWGVPISPTAFIETAVNDPKVNSDAIRAYTKRALQHAGVELPNAIADMTAPQGGPIIRPSCSGCPARINTTCLTPDCRAAKIEAFKAQTIADAEAVLNIPFSDLEDDFTFATWEDKKVLQEIWISGQQRGGTNFVFGWRTNEAALRPFMENRLAYVHMSDVLEEDGRQAIAIGHRGYMPLHLLPANARREAMPDSATRQAWQKEAKKLMKQAMELAQEALWDMIDRRLDDGLMDMMQALIARPELDWQYERDGQIKVVLTHLLEYGSGAVRQINDLRDFEKMRTMLNRAGMDADAVLSTGAKATNLRRQGILALHYYWCTGNYERSYSYDKVRPQLAAAINAFDASAPYAQVDEEYATIHTELKRALRHLDQQEKANEEKANA